MLHETSKKLNLLSIIIPVFNEQENIIPLQEEIIKYCPNNFELIFIDDGSTDESFKRIENISNKDRRYKCISLSRNFGHQNALMAGMLHASGDVIITMDGDIQHPPSLIPQMLRYIEEGNDIVFTHRKNLRTNRYSKEQAQIFSIDF